MNCLYGVVGDEGRGVQARDEGFDELLHAVFERSEERRGRSVCGGRHFLSCRQHGAAETAVSALPFGEAWKDGAYAEAGGFAAVDAGEQRIGEAVDHFCAVVTLYQGRNAFVGFGCTRRMQ